MDPLTALGLAASIIQFINFGMKIVSRVEELNSANPGEVPRSLQAIGLQLPLLLNSLNKVSSESQIQKLDVDTRCILRGVVSGCQAQIALVEDMINEIAHVPGETLKTKLKKVFASLKYDEKVWEVERNLQTYISVLMLHHVVHASDVPKVLTQEAFFDVRETIVPDFVERPKLMQELHDRYHEASRSRVKNPVIVTLNGDKGVGKTQLAVAYCQSTNFRTVFWLDASTLENLCLGFESMYATIRHATDGSRNDKIGFVRAFLSDLWHPWLLVLDNYEPTALYNNIMEMLPSRGYGGILLITRGSAANTLGEVIDVPKFLSFGDQQHLNSLLGQQIEKKDTEAVKDLVNQGADPNTLIWDQWPVFHRAVLHGMEEAAFFLLEKGADIDPPVNVGKPLHWAVTHGYESITRRLLDHEDTTEQFLTAAIYQAAFDKAAAEGHLSTMRILASRREVSFIHKNHYDETPLQSAAKNGYVEIIQYVVERGALKESQEQGNSALIQAASSGHVEIVKLLCSEGNVNINATDTRGMTALCHAAGFQDQAIGEVMVAFLLANGANPNLLGSDDGPLHRAALYNHVKIVQLLLDHGADPTMDCGGWCPLTNTIKYKSPEATDLLLQAKINDSDARKSWLESGLRYACRTGDRESVLKLLTAGADINAEEKQGRPKGATPLLLAIVNGHVKTAQLLIRRGAKQDISDEEGRLPLPTAAKAGLDLIVKDLLRAGGDANMKCGSNEDTSLIIAAAGKTESHVKVVKALLSGGADRDLSNKFGDLALDVAEETGWQDMIAVLEG